MEKVQKNTNEQNERNTAVYTQPKITPVTGSVAIYWSGLIYTWYTVQGRFQQHKPWGKAYPIKTTKQQSCSAGNVRVLLALRSQNASYTRFTQA